LPAERSRRTRSALVRAALLGCVATTLLGGCVSRPRPIATDDRYAPLVEGPNMRIVRGEDVPTKPLNPEPGDVWADIVPDRETALAEEGPPPRSAGAKRTGVGQSKEAATAITTPLEADWPVSQAAQAAAASDLSPAGTSAPSTRPPAPSASGANDAATAATHPTSSGKDASTGAPAAPDGAAPRSGAAAAASTNASTASAAGPAPGAHAATSRARPSADAAGASGRPAHGREVQLAAAGSPAEAEATWARLVGRYPALLQGRSPILRQGEANGRQVWRLRTGGFGSAAEAKRFCDRLRGAGGTCWVATSI
ncbi:MAG: SPOR domain-containing protein, partial [Rhodospirillales bacterium]|nr:SPOR domain-containing protein [Rhodospirillales bacterium]